MHLKQTTFSYTVVWKLIQGHSVGYTRWNGHYHSVCNHFLAPCSQYNGSSFDVRDEKEKLKGKKKRWKETPIKFSNRYHNGFLVTLSFRGVTVHEFTFSESHDEVWRSRWNQQQTAFSTVQPTTENVLQTETKRPVQTESSMELSISCLSPVSGETRRTVTFFFFPKYIFLHLHFPSEAFPMTGFHFFISFLHCFGM